MLCINATDEIKTTVPPLNTDCARLTLCVGIQVLLTRPIIANINLYGTSPHTPNRAGNEFRNKGMGIIHSYYTHLKVKR